MEWNGVPFLQHLENPRFNLVPFPGSPKEGQPCSYLEVLRAENFIAMKLRVVVGLVSYLGLVL